MCNFESAMVKLVEERQELKRMKEELEAEISALDEQIKAAMGEEENAIAGAFKVTCKMTSRKTLDSKGLVELLGKDALEPYYKVSTYRTLTIR